jgi:hypothetical protein
MSTGQSVAVRSAAAVAVFVAVTAALILVVRPFDGGPAASDAASSVLFWDRIVAGQRLEVFVNTTPKPLLTVVYGVLHAIDPSWRLVSLSSVLVTALGIVLAGEVARRVAGVPAAAFTIVALAGNLWLLAEASWAYGLGWAFAGWMAAALALLRPVPRYATAGVFLALASLARPETFLVLGVAALLLVGTAVLRRPAPRRAWLILLGFVGILGLLVHDLALTGDPWWWTKVASHAVEVNGGRSRSLPATIRLTQTILVPQLPLVAGATVGGLLLLWRRQWVAAAGLVALGPLVILETWALALRHVNVLAHYLHPVHLALILGSAVTVGTAVTMAKRWVRERAGRVAMPIATGALVVVAVWPGVALARPHAWLDPSARREIMLEGQLDARAAGAMTVIRSALGDAPAAAIPAPGALGAVDPRSVKVFVPRHRLPRAAVDLGLPLTTIAVLDASRVDLAAGDPPVGSIVYLDTVIDPTAKGESAAPLRVTAPTPVGNVQVVPLQVDPAAGIWIVRIAPGG